MKNERRINEVKNLMDAMQHIECGDDVWYDVDNKLNLDLDTVTDRELEAIATNESEYNHFIKWARRIIRRYTNWFQPEKAWGMA